MFTFFSANGVILLIWMISVLVLLILILKKVTLAADNSRKSELLKSYENIDELFETAKSNFQSGHNDKGLERLYLTRELLNVSKVSSKKMEEVNKKIDFYEKELNG